jgi:acetyl esterase/lipase
MKYILLIFIVFTHSITQCSAEELLLWLENNQGIVENSEGSVIRWENQIALNGDATQNNAELGGEQMEETYPGKVNVGFNKNGSFLGLVGSSAYFSDGTFSVFYAGKTGDVNKLASLFGNMKAEDDQFEEYSGFRFVRQDNGDIAFQYSSPSWTQIILNQLPEDEFFFFGFTLNATGEFKYFDNILEEVVTGTIGNAIVHSDRDVNLNLVLKYDGSATYDHTEVAEMMVYDNFMSDTRFQEMKESYAISYPELVTSSFEIAQVTPVNRTELLIADPISIVFSNEMEQPVYDYPSITLNKSTLPVVGNWSVTAPNTISFTSDQDWPYGALVKVVINPLLKSIDDVNISIAARSVYNFIVETEDNYVVEEVIIPTVTTRNEGTHNIPGELVIPLGVDKKVPLHFWIHGGGWSGGTLTESFSSKSPHADYLAKHLGVATMGVAYRTKGSEGNFTQAMIDIDAAYQWALANAKTYNFDMSKVIFSGGSAGAPLAALAAQRYSSTQAFVGFNGIYNFKEDELSNFGGGNGYGQEDPTPEANSAYYQLSFPAPATLLLHGTADTTINIGQSTSFADLVANEGGISKMVEYQDEPHAFFNSKKQAYEDVLYEMVTFLTSLGLTGNTNNSLIPPVGLVEIKNTALNAWLESTALPDPTNASKNEVRLNIGYSNSNVTYWNFVESPETGWYNILTESGDYLQLTNIVDVQNNTTGLALRTTSSGSGTGSWVKWKLVASITSGQYYIENQNFNNYVRATQEIQDEVLQTYFIHGADITNTGSWTKWTLIE